jgi:hypothetical protein
MKKKGSKGGQKPTPLPPSPRGQKEEKRAQCLRNQNQEPGTVLAGVCAWRRVVVIAAQRWRTLLLSAAAAEVSLTEVPASHLRTYQLLLLVRSSLVTSDGRLLISCLFCFKLSCKNFYQVSMLYAASDVAPHLVKVLDVRFCCRRCSAKC